MSSKALPSRCIGQMYLDERQIHTDERVSKGDARMCQASRVDDHAVRSLARLLQVVQNGPL